MIPLRSTVLALLLLGAASSASALPPTELIKSDEVRVPKKIPEELEVPPSPEAPWPIRLMIRPFPKGMFIRLPIVDTDPNRGVTYGVMPIWVLQGKDETRILYIHAPSLTYNDSFKFTPTYRFYYYPTPKASYAFRTSLSGRKNREIMGEMEDMDFLRRGIAATARLQYDVDASKRFFGLGPDSSRHSETNFTRQMFHYRCRVGLPLFHGSGIKFNIAHHLAGERIATGAINTLPDIGDLFPEHKPARWHQDSELQLFIDYDTRDDSATTTRGTYVKFAIENSQNGFGSEFSFQRYGIDLRHFHNPDMRPWPITALRFQYEQLVGDAPFYMLPSLGGKKVHRAYGAGRYIDKGMYTATIEERFIAYSTEVAGVTTEVEVAPFFGLGTVFGTPKRITNRYTRPVVGTAFRAIARPQVVGSVDVGIGQEGPSVFMDINYSF
ncbi:MAG: BamA/TamA family outer membrane protein [Elusimicrobiota bacterium]